MFIVNSSVVVLSVITDYRYHRLLVRIAFIDQALLVFRLPVS
jgi:hypothetical protein